MSEDMSELTPEQQLEALLNGPALAPPNNHTIPNFADPPNQNGLAMFVLVFCSIISTLCVMLRAYGRVYLLKRFQFEEGLIVCAFGIYWGCLWCALGFMEQPGYFVNQWNVLMKTLIPMTYYIFVMGNLYVVVLGLLKVAMLLEWSRVLVPRSSRSSSIFWWSCMAMIAIQAIACVGIVIGLNLQCIPHEASWDFTIPNPKCFPLYRLQLSSGIIYLATDIIMFFMPQHLIWQLQMSWKKRLGVSVVFGLGAVACVAAGFRLHVTINVGKSADGTYSIGELIFWVFAEMACGFFVVCMPCIPKILRDSGTIRSLKRKLGMSTKGPSQTSGMGGSKSGISGSRVTQSTTGKPYYKLDEDGVGADHMRGIPMRDMETGSTSSTEQLRAKESGRTQIVRTTQITVQKQPANDEYGRRPHPDDSKQSWAI